MKILKEGDLPEQKQYQWDCRTCNSEILAIQSEGRIVYDQRDGNAVVFKCPVCNQENWIKL